MTVGGGLMRKDKKTIFNSESAEMICRFTHGGKYTLFYAGFKLMKL